MATFSYYIQYPDGSRRVCDPVDESGALSAFKGVSWEYEFSKFDPNRDRHRPGICFQNADEKLYLHICPCDDGTADFTFGFPKQRTMFGILHWISSSDHYAEYFPIAKVDELIHLFYTDQFDAIVLLGQRYPHRIV
jgi:hypothetical protein